MATLGGFCKPVVWTVGAYNYYSDWDAVKRDLTDWDQWQNAIPVWGSSRQAGYAINQGEYLSAATYFGLGLFEMFTLGIGSEYAMGVKSTMTSSIPKRVYTAVPIEQGGGFTSKIVAEKGSRVFEVGSYTELRGAEAGLEAHHVGQKALMNKFVPGYNSNTAPSILVPKLGHTQGTGILLRGTTGFSNARQVLARDIFELRRVYPNVPNNSLQQLIWMNKSMYPYSFFK